MREELSGLFGMRLHVLELGVVELAGLEEELIAHRDLAVVVEERRRTELLELDPFKAERPSDHLGVSRHALAVSSGLLVARIDRHGERLDEGGPQAPLLGEKLRVLDRDGG